MKHVIETALLVEDLEEGTTQILEEESFLQDNQEDLELVGDIKALKVGGLLHVGGGAQPHIKITRVKR